MNINDFVSQNNGKYLDFDGAYGAQCVDLVQYWCQSLNGPRLSGNAVDLSGQTHNGFFRWIENTPAGVPRAGDIMVWGEYAPFGISQYGHTGVFIEGDVNSFRSFDQNWPTGHPCGVVNHVNYGGVLGWLQPVCLDPAAPAPAPTPAPVDPAPVETPVDPAPVVPSEPPVITVTPVPETPKPTPTPTVIVPVKGDPMKVTPKVHHVLGVAAVVLGVLYQLAGALSAMDVVSIAALVSAALGIIEKL